MLFSRHFCRMGRVGKTPVATTYRHSHSSPNCWLLLKLKYMNRYSQFTKHIFPFIFLSWTASNSHFLQSFKNFLCWCFYNSFDHLGDIVAVRNAWDLWHGIGSGRMTLMCFPAYRNGLHNMMGMKCDILLIWLLEAKLNIWWILKTANPKCIHS